MPNRSGRHSSKTAASASEPGDGISGDGIRTDVTYRDLAVVREPLAVEAEPGIEAGAEILERDPGGQLDELRIAEERPDARGQLVRDLSRAGGCRFGVLEDRPLALVEEIARAPAADRSHLGRIDALVHT